MPYFYPSHNWGVYYIPKLKIYMTKLLAKCLCGAFLLYSCASQQNSEAEVDADLLRTADQNLQDAARQYKVLKENLPPGRFPRTYLADSETFVTSGSEWWTSGFYPGTLFYLYEETGDTALYQEGLRILELLKKEQYNTTTHDLGFMMFDSYGHANRINPKPEYKEVLINSARSLASRFDPEVGAIRSWDSDSSDFIVIIDNMMNLELLFWATEVTGDSSFYNIAVTHANTTTKNHFRDDYSTYHVINYDPLTGKVQEKKTAQGYSDASAWARGQAWGLYGYTETYRKTKDPQYLRQAQNIADFILSHPNLPADKVPYWDFNAPDIPTAYRDASAASIMAAALLELSQYTEGEKGQTYFNAAETMLRTLSGPEYKAEIGTNGGFILKHGVGHLPENSEVDVPLTYGDYYFVEALVRYKKLANGEDL